MKLKIFTAIICSIMTLQLSAQSWSTNSNGYQWAAPGGQWDAANTRYIGQNQGSYPWTLTPRTGLVDAILDPYDRSLPIRDTLVRSSTNYYVSERIKGFWEYLPRGYNDPANSSKTYAVIIYIPGCGEMHDGRLYLHPAVTSGTNQRPAIPNFEFGLGRMMKKVGCDFSQWNDLTVYNDKNNIVKLPSCSYGNRDNFNSLPRELMRNGDYFSNIPLKAPGQVYNNTTGPKEGVIVIALNMSAWPMVCIGGRYTTPLAGDIDGAINMINRNYRVDPSRIYLTGMSAGGGISYNYPASMAARAKKIAAIAPVAAVENIYGDPTMAATIINNGVNVLAITNRFDYSNNVIYNNRSSIIALKTVPGVVAGQADSAFFTYSGQTGANHNAWTYAYATRYSGTANFYPYRDPISNENYTVYEWLLTKQNLSLLPVNVVSYTATKVNEGVRLDWKTAQEVNSDHFTLERSTDGSNFVKINEQRTAGTSAVEHKYTHLDRDVPAAQYVYYKLSQTDRDGRMQVIGVKKLYNASAGFEVALYPTVATNSLTVEIQGTVNQTLTARVVDMTGKQLMQQAIAPRQNRVNLNVGSLAKGIYMVSVVSPDKTITLKFVKQ